MERIKKNFGFGCMRLPMRDGEVDTAELCRMVDAFLEAGFNYFDTAHGYVNTKSEPAVRACLTSRYPRDSYILTTKLPCLELKEGSDPSVYFDEQLQKCGVDSEILIRTKVHDDTQAMEIFKNPIQKFGSKAKNVVNLTLSKKDIISDYLGTDVSAHPMVRDADVLVLHWVNSFLSYRSVEKLLATGKTVIWVMHDMWTFTGGCHYDGYCGGYAHDCGNCPHMESRKENDLSRRNFVRKTRAIKSGKMIFVGPSQWSVDCAGKSRTKDRQNIKSSKSGCVLQKR